MFLVYQTVSMMACTILMVNGMVILISPLEQEHIFTFSILAEKQMDFGNLMIEERTTVKMVLRIGTMADIIIVLKALMIFSTESKQIMVYLLSLTSLTWKWLKMTMSHWA